MQIQTRTFVKSKVLPAPRRLWDHFCADALFRNSIYLMTSTGVMAVLGFFFWMINARLFTTEQVGLATTIISMISLITSFGLLGLDVGLIRYLPKSLRNNDQINTCFLISAIATLVVVLAFLTNISRISPRLMFIRENPYYMLLFIIFSVFATSNSMIENIFIALRNTKFILIKNTIFSILKLVLPFFLVAFGTYGILSSWMVALIIGFMAGVAILITNFEYKPRLAMHKDIIKEMGKFSFGNYVSGFIGILPTMVLPLLITNLINPETTAYYYMAMMIAGLLFVIPQAASQSLFAEGSYNEEALVSHIKKTVKTVSLILLPAVLTIVLFGKYILLAFGKNYSNGGLLFLKLLVISSVFVSLNSIFTTIIRIKRKIKFLILINLLGTSSTLLLSYLLIQHSLVGIGLAWILGQALVSLGCFVLLSNKRLINFHSLLSN